MERTNITKYVWLAGWGLIIFLAIYLRVDNLSFGLPEQRLHPDEWSQVETAWRVVQTGDLNPHFFRYPSATIYLFAVVYRVLGNLGISGGIADLYFVGRVISVVFSVGLIVLSGLWISGWVQSRTTGLFAALLMALIYTAVEQAHYAIVDNFLSFWMALSLIFCIQAVKMGDSVRARTQLILAALFAGIAIATKYTGVLLVVPLIISGWQAESPAREVGGSRSRLIVSSLTAVLLLIGAIGLLSFRTRILDFATTLTTDGVLEPEYLSLYMLVWASLLLGGFLLILVSWILYKKPHLAVWNKVFSPNIWLMLLIVFIVFLVLSPFVFIDWRQAAQDVFYEYRHIRIGPAAHIAVSSPNYKYLLPTGFLPSHKEFSMTILQQWGWPALVLMFFGAVMLWVHNRKPFYILISFVLLMSFTLVSAGNWADRYALPLYFPIAFLAAYGISKTLTMFSRNRSGGIAFVCVYGLCIFPITTYTLQMAAFFNLAETRELAYGWMLDNVKPGSLVVEDANTPDFGIVHPPFQVQVVVPYVLDAYSPEQLHSKGVQVIVTTQPITTATQVHLPDQQDELVPPSLSQFYSLVKVFGPDLEMARGREIYIFESKVVER